MRILAKVSQTSESIVYAGRISRMSSCKASCTRARYRERRVEGLFTIDGQSMFLMCLGSNGKVSLKKEWNRCRTNLAGIIGCFESHDSNEKRRVADVELKIPLFAGRVPFNGSR